MKVAVEVLEAHDLMPKEEGGTASPFVEVDFEGQRHRTQTKPHDLNPFWNEVLFFHIADPLDLPSRTIHVAVYHDRSAGGGHLQSRSFLGRVRISGSSVAPCRAEAAIQVCPLDRRRFFSRVRGDLSLRFFAVPSSSKASSTHVPSTTTTVPENHSSEKPLPATKERKVFHTVGFEPAQARSREFMDMENKHSRSHHFRAEAPPPATSAIKMEALPQPKPDYGLKETQPPVAARRGYRGGAKITNTYDLVEQMEHLYVNIVKARNLPAMDITGSVDPYVEVKLGNFYGKTKHLEQNQNPEWHQVFAFSKEHLQADRLEVSVKDRDLLKDGFVGKVTLPLAEVPSRLPPDSPLAPQWYRLEDKRREKLGKGELMMAVWKGSQADEAYPEAWHSDAHNIPFDAVLHTRSKVYFAPRLCYLRVHAIAAQDLLPSEATRHQPEIHVKVQLGSQIRFTRPSPVRSLNPSWNEELMLVGYEPFDEPVIITVEDRLAPGKDVPLGRLVLAKPRILTQADHRKIIPAQWFDLSKPSSFSDDTISSSEERRRASRFSSKLHLRIFYDAGYHVIDEPVQYSSDFQPSSKPLRKKSIGILDLGILGAKDLVPTKAGDGVATTDAYCVAKYGQKWVRTRTLLGSLSPKWNEQYTWDVFDHCTVLTIAVFDNRQLHNNGNGSKDQKIGKIRIRLSTLVTNKLYTHYYPLLSLQPSGLKKLGELHLAIRFTCTAWTNMLTLYVKPMLPRIHYLQPIPVMQMNYLRNQAMGVVMSRLARAEPPLSKEVVEYVLDVGSQLFSVRRSKANFGRVVSLLSGVTAAASWFDGIRNWKNSVTTILVHVLFLILVFHPALILPTVFLYLFAIGAWNYGSRPTEPPHMDSELSCVGLVTADDLDEEFDPYVTTRPINVVRRRYDQLRVVSGRVQELGLGFLATQGERLQGLLSWRDPRATVIFVVFSGISAVILFVTPVEVVLLLAGLYLLRHPRFRSKKMPSVPYNFFRRLPAKSDLLL